MGRRLLSQCRPKSDNSVSVWGRPAKQTQPALAMHGDLVQAVAAQLPESEVVMLPRQLVPALVLGRSYRPDLHLTQWNHARPHSLRYRIRWFRLGSPLPFFADQSLPANIKRPCVG